MARFVITRTLAATLVAVALQAAQAAQAAKPSALDALKLKPIQADVDYDTPEGAAADKCSIVPYTSGRTSGWEVLDGNQRVLRRFLDTNRDNKVDQWCYFKDGIEVYRDVDSNYNRKADQYRWLGTAGIRWGVDQNEDGKIDRWTAISPEEVSAEVVDSLRTRDAVRFRRLLLSTEELGALRLGEAQTKQLQRKITKAAAEFENFAGQQKFVDDSTHWVNFGGTRPGIVPAGTDGSQRDLQVYENAAAIVESKSNASQIIIGTLVRVGDAWRLIDLPKAFSDVQAGNATDGFFFQKSLVQAPDAVTPIPGGLSPELQKLIGRLEPIDKELALIQTPVAMAKLNASRADVLEELAKLATKDEDRATWVRQLADTVSAAAQAGGYPEGVQRLDSLYQRLKKDKVSAELLAYVKFRQLSADYGQKVQQPNVDFAKIQQQWLDNLQQFVKDFPKSSDAAEAMLQLALAKEFAGQDDAAVQWYSRIATDFPTTAVARKAIGAKRRIESVGKPFALEGKDLQGNTVRAASSRGKVLLIHYWATWCEPCKQDLSLLKDKLAKYGKDGLAVIGVNVDNQRSELDAYVAENPLPWPQLYEPGGLDSPLAYEWGVLTLPTMILVDKTGIVVRRNLHATEVERELSKLLRKSGLSTARAGQTPSGARK